MKFGRINLPSLLAGLALLIWTDCSKLEAIAASVKSTGMAATAIAYPLDALCTAYNPAGMVWIGDRLDIGVDYLHDRGSINVKGNLNPLVAGVNGKFTGMRTQNFFSGEFGFNKVWCYKELAISTGMATYDRNFQKTTYKHPLPLFGTSRAGLEYVNYTISPTVAVYFNDWLSFGLSIDWQIQRLKVNGLQNFDNPVSSAFPGHVTNREYSYAQGVTPTIGWRGQITKNIALAATYRPKAHMRNFKKYKGFLAQHGRLDVPEKIGAAISVNIGCWTACFDFEFIRWDNVRALHNPLLPNLLVSQLGRKDGAGFGFRNQPYYRVGVEWQATDCWTFRAGFRHARTAVRRTQTAVNVLTLDCVEDFVTVGGTWLVSARHELSWYYAHGFQKKVKGKNSIPAVFGGGNIDIKEQKDAAALSWGWRY